MTQTIESFDVLIEHIEHLQSKHPPEQRLLIGIVGAPGAGKSTLASEICQRMNEANGETAPFLPPAVVVPMDGFHLDDAILHERQQRAVKGAPHTYDVEGFVSLVRRLANSCQETLYVPVFDREAELSRNAAQCVEAHHRVILVEGNYLLLAKAGWSELAPLFHLSLMLDVPMETLEERLIQRWLSYGFEPEQARERALANDIPNAQVVVEESQEAHLLFQSVRQ